MSRSRRFLVAAAAVCVGLVVLLALRTSPAVMKDSVRPDAAKVGLPKQSAQWFSSNAVASPISPARESLDGQPALSPPLPSELTLATPPPLAARLGDFNTKPEQEVKIVLDLLNVYRRLLGSFPAGEDNRQFTNALLGANKEHLPFIAFNHPRINARGEIVDAWGTPFLFHMQSRNFLEVRSAGADGKFFSADDSVAGSRKVAVGASPLE